MVERERHAFDVAQGGEMLFADKRLLGKILETQQIMRKKEKILTTFKEESGYVAGAEKRVIANIYSNFSFANLDNERLFRRLEKNFTDIQGSYQMFKMHEPENIDEVAQR